eukprot:1200655-Amphidinium_carterae.1
MASQLHPRKMVCMGVEVHCDDCVIGALVRLHVWLCKADQEAFHGASPLQPPCDVSASHHAELSTRSSKPTIPPLSQPRCRELQVKRGPRKGSKGV